MLNQRYIKFLLQKQQQEGLTKEEEQLLDSWYNSLDAMPDTDLPESALQEMKQQSWEQLIKGHVVTPRSRRRWLNWSMGAAAAALVLVGSTYLLKRTATPAIQEQTPKWVVLECPPGKRLKMTMPDGSNIWLNSGSRLEYDSNFTDRRHFKIYNGEVFFEVAKDVEHPFTVQTKQLSIKVLGTAFNVAAYEQLSLEKITVASGSVQVKDAAHCNVVLQRDEQIVYNRTDQQFLTQNVTSGQTDSWRNGDIYLTDVSLEELAIKLEHTYGYTFEFSNDGLKHCINSLHFNEKEPIQKVLDLLQLINKIHYEIRGNQIRLSGRGC
jgi:transmembrane sensor